MPYELLRTKLTIPQAPPQLLSRQRLIERFSEGLQRRLTLVSAPAGFGKTVLIIECQKALRTPFTWFSIEEDDNDPTRFWSYFIAALQRLDRNLGYVAQQMLQSPEAAPIRTILTVLINEIVAERNKPYPYIVVLDDYQVIHNSVIHNDMSFLVEHMPLQLHIVISTRSDPPLTLPRWRIRSHLSELRSEDLRFNQEETATFLNNIMGIRLNTEDVKKLDKRTEGWIAGIQMAAISLRHSKNPSAFIKTFSGSHQYIMDYLMEEVFNSLSSDIQSFLLKTSIIENLNASLCGTIVGISESAKILRYLEQSNLFITSLDEERHWYRYHNLMRDLLQQRLLEELPESLPTLHSLASEWYERNQMVPQAIYHALSSGDIGKVASLVEGNAENSLMRGELTIVLGWMELFPEEVMQNHPYLCVLHATALLYSNGAVELIEKRLSEADSHKDNSSLFGHIATIHALVTLLKGDTKLSASHLQQAIEMLPENSLLFQTIAITNLALLHAWRGEITSAMSLFEKIRQIGKGTGSIMMTVLAARRMASLMSLQARLFEARDVHEEILKLATDKMGNPLPIAGYAYIGLGDLFREWNDLDSATRYTTLGIGLIKEWQQLGAILGYFVLSQIKTSQLDLDGAKQALEVAVQLTKEYRITDVYDIFIAVYQARLAIKRREFESVQQWIQNRKLMEQIMSDCNPEEEKFYLRELEFITLARFFLYQEKYTEVLRVVTFMLPTIEKLEHTGTIIEVLILKALALLGQTKFEDALDAIGHALKLAEPSGYISIFLDEGESALRLLRLAAARGISSQYVSKLITSFADSRHQILAFQPEQGTRESIQEALSEREIEILRLVTSGLSNQEIADTLFVSVGTVKKHVYNICRKLNTNNRTQAAARARELGLL